MNRALTLLLALWAVFSISLALPSSDHPGVIFSNRSRFEEKWVKFVHGGASSLQVITDFDMTLTRFRVNGEKGSSTHGVIARSPALGAEFAQKAQELYDTYYPLEISPSIEHALKFEKMVEWWTKSHELMKLHGLKKSHIPKALEESPIDLREGTAELFRALERENIPILIFSAGIGDVIHEFLSKKAINQANVHVVSNQLIFDEAEQLKDFGELIHSLNKNAEMIQKTQPSWSCESLRKNILLLGDNITDIHMPEGLSFSEVLSVGFLNDQTEARLPLFTATFDVVILNDGPMHFVQSLLDNLLLPPASVS